MKDRVGVGEEADAERPDGQPRHEVAEDRAEPEPLEQRNGDDARGEKGDDLNEFVRGPGCFDRHGVVGPLDVLESAGRARGGACGQGARSPL